MRNGCRTTSLAFASVVLVAALSMLTTACGQNPQAPSPITVNVSNTNQNTNNQGGGSGGGSGQPGGGSSVAIGHVEVHQFGEVCPSGGQPSGQQRSVKVGCVAYLTCSPYDTAGKEIMDASSRGLKPDSFGPGIGAEHVTVSHGSEPFNLDAKGSSGGQVAFRCTVSGVQSEEWDLQVVQ